MSIPTHGINVGNIYKVKILGVGKDGDGFTKVNNFIIFIPATTKDQEVNIKITRVLKKYAFGKVLEGEPAEGEVVHDATTGSVSNQANANQSQPATKIQNDAVANPGEEVKAEEEE
jgi:predicted RNA-binding protein with TRAM domain